MGLLPPHLISHLHVLAGRYVVPLLLHVGPSLCARSAPVGLCSSGMAQGLSERVSATLGVLPVRE